MVDHSATGALGHCDTCQSSFTCCNLSTIRAILDTNREELQDPKLLNLRDRVERRLQAAGWHYPAATAACGMAEAPLELRKMVDDLIDAWRRHCTSVASVRSQSLHADEVYQE